MVNVFTTDIGVIGEVHSQRVVLPNPYMEAVMINRNRCSANIKGMIAEMRMRLSHIYDDIFNTDEIKFTIFVFLIEQRFRL
ncbi:MAG: hypothetical protein EA393_04215 [Bacteroidetes bacterium]|nr:MAG: hypothetical protein EA393_04215 [Bacteroidota bacterium]